MADNAPLPPKPHRLSTGFNPFELRTHFEITDFLYRRAEMSGKKIDELMQLWACTLDDDKDPPFAGHTHMYDTIDAISQGDVPWQRFSISWNGALSDGPLPSWQIWEYEVFFRDPRLVLHNQLGNAEYDKDIDYVPKRVMIDGQRQLKDFMSADWVWTQAVIHTLYCHDLCAHYGHI